MDGAQQGAHVGHNFVIVGGSAVDGSSRITQDIVADWLTRLQHAVSHDRPRPPSTANHAAVDSSSMEENDVVVEVQEFVPEEEITVVESGEVVHSKAPSRSKCCEVSVLTFGSSSSSTRPEASLKASISIQRVYCRHQLLQELY